MAAPKEQYEHHLPFAIHELRSGETVLNKFAILATHEPLLRHGFGENDKYLRFAIYLSSGSGLHQAVPEWPKRKAEALRLAGIKPDDRRAPAILAGEDEAVTEMRWCFMRAYCPMEYAEYVALVERYYQNLVKIEQPIKEVEGKDNSRDYILCAQLAEDMPTLRAAIKALSKELFMGDEEMKRLAAERAKPQAETGSIEEKIMNRKSK